MKRLLTVAVLGGAFWCGAGDPSARAASLTSEPTGNPKLAPLAAVQLNPSDGANGDYFGNAVSLSGDGNTALIAAPYKTMGTQSFQGSAYIFVRSGNGWVQQAQLQAEDAAANCEFGYSVSLSGDGNTALVGAMGSAAQPSQGCAYVFVRAGTNWLQQAKLTATGETPGDGFAISVALNGDGNTALVGAPHKTVGTHATQGAAYVFVRNDSGWRQQAELMANDAAAQDWFGAAVALSADGQTALIGASQKTINNQTAQGACYIFMSLGSGWHQQSILTANNGAAQSAFGQAVALSGDGATALIAAPIQPTSLGMGVGASYVFVGASGTWSQQAQLYADNAPTGDRYGEAVALSGDGNTALVSSRSTHDYIFVRSSGYWALQNELLAGEAISLSSDASTAVAGNTSTGPGTAYVLGATYTITVSAAPPNAGTVGGGGTFAAGSAQMVTAQPNPGYAFTNWTENGAVTSSVPNYTFTLDGDRTLVANFVAVSATNVTSARGTYRGLFSSGGNAAQNSSGCFTLTTTSQGMLSASFMVGGTRYSSRGAFDCFGCCTQILRSAKGSGYTVHFQLSAADPDQLYGTVNAVDGSWSAALVGDRAIYHRVTNTAPQAGKYTLVIPGSYGAANLPGGDGFGTVKVDAGGKVTLKGSLADGTSISQSSALSKDGEWPLYVRLHGGKGSFQGWVVLAATPTNDLSGTLAWVKPALPKAKYYPAGFSLQTAAPGFHYVPPAKGAPVLNLNQAVLVLSGGGLAQDLTNSVTLSANNRVTGPQGTSLTFTPSTGAFKGSVLDVNGRRISCRGVALQSTNGAQGYFLGAGGQSGQVILSAP